MSRGFRRAPSDLYQVDFVAALFGGFLLIWLTGAGESELRGDSGESVVVFEMSGRATFRNGGSHEATLLVLPNSLVRMGCAHDNLVAKMRTTSNWVSSCRIDNTQELLKPQTNDFSYDQIVSAARAESSHAVIFLSAFGTDMTLFSKTNRKLSAVYAGLAIRRAVGSSPPYHVGIGILPSDFGNQLMIRLNKPEIYDVSRYSVPIAKDQAAPATHIDKYEGYFFDGINGRVAPRSFPTFVRIEFWVRIDQASGGRCYYASSIAGFIGDVEMIERAC